MIYNEGQWRLSRVSPLYNLQYDAVKLKQYSSKIRQEIICGAIASSTTKYTVKFEEQPDLKYSENDSNGLMVIFLYNALLSGALWSCLHGILKLNHCYFY